MADAQGNEKDAREGDIQMLDIAGDASLSYMISLVDVDNRARISLVRGLREQYPHLPAMIRSAFHNGISRN